MVRINIGNLNPNNPAAETEAAKAMEFLNRCLNDQPRGRIIGQEINFGVFKIGEHQVTLQRITYHVGFPRKPYWLGLEPNFAGSRFS